MARTANKLTDAKCKAVLEKGRYADGNGLYLNVGATGGKSWVFLWTVSEARQGKVVRKWREMGLGPYPAVKLATARKSAAECREAVASGRDPIAERRKEAEPLFSECVAAFLKDNETQWRNPKHRAQFRMTLGPDYCSHILNMRVAAIDTSAVLKVLRPVWTEKPETASRLRGRIERVLDFAKARGWRGGENPARWRGHLQNVLPAPRKLVRGHHTALHYSQLPQFMQLLRTHEAVSARALEFLILTAARTGEVLGAEWTEFDLDASLWVVPARRMKIGKEHRVPLSDVAANLIRALHDVRVSDYVFPGQKTGRALSNMAMLQLLKRMNMDVTTHGFRSSFRDWAGDVTDFPRDIVEHALSHRVGNATELAYRRGDALEKRRTLMQAWASFCSGNS